MFVLVVPLASGDLAVLASKGALALQQGSKSRGVRAERFGRDYFQEEGCPSFPVVCHGKPLTSGRARPLEGPLVSLQSIIHYHQSPETV